MKTCGYCGKPWNDGLHTVVICGTFTMYVCPAHAESRDVTFMPHGWTPIIDVPEIVD